jgi:hypothetical protein
MQMPYKEKLRKQSKSYIRRSKQLNNDPASEYSWTYQTTEYTISVSFLLMHCLFPLIFFALIAQLYYICYALFVNIVYKKRMNKFEIFPYAADPCSRLAPKFSF